MFNRILVPLDGSALAERAIPHAEQFARIFGSSIVLLRVLEVAPHHENPDSIDPLSWQIYKTEADMYLCGIASDIRDRLQGSKRNTETEATTEDRVEYAILEGGIAENIIDFAHNENIDLLVISSHGLGGLSRWNLSSVIQKVVDLIYLPLLIVRSYDLQWESGDRVHYRRILLPIDSSRRAECALPAGIVLAQGEAMLLEHSAEEDLPRNKNSLEMGLPVNDVSLKPNLILAAIISPPEIPIPKPYPVAISKLIDKLLQVSREAVLAYLSEMNLRLPVGSEIRVVENEDVFSAIQELADQEDIDLILMSAHGHTGQFLQPYGSVTCNCIDNGTKPILIIQDVPLSKVRPTVAAVAAKESGRR